MKIAQKRRGRKRIALRIVLVVVLTVLFFVAVFCNSFISRDFADFYGKNIFPYISMPAQRFNMFFHYSLTENLVVCGVPLLLIGFIVWTSVHVKKFLTKGALDYLYKSYRNLMIVALLGAVIFQAMHGSITGEHVFPKNLNWQMPN